MQYWTAQWQDEPVWIKAQSPLETYPRYALIHDYRTPADGFPYGQPFWPQLAQAAIGEFTLLIERGHWTATQPGEGTLTEICASEVYDGRNLGNVDSSGTDDPTTNEEVYAAFKRNEANLSDVYYWDTAGGVWSPNLMDAALTFDLFQNPVVAGDVIVFGINTLLQTNGDPPFASLVFDLVTAQNDLTITWRYSAGGADPTAWPALTVQDNTNDDGAMTGQAFNTTGVKSVHWMQPSAWTTQNPTIGGVAVGVTGLWVAAHVTAIGGTPTPPTQQHRDIYSVVWPYYEILNTALGGDIAALARIALRNQSHYTGAGGSILYPQRIWAGLRSISRGSSFTAYINLSDEQNPAGITVTVPGASTAFTSDVTSPTGRVALFNPAGVEALAPEVQVEFSQAIQPSFHGIYHIFLRVSQSGGIAGDFTVQLRVSWGSFLYGEEVRVDSTTSFYVLDLGRFQFPTSSRAKANEAMSFDSIIMVAASNSEAVAPGDLSFIDLFLLPVDEWSGDFRYVYVGNSRVQRPKYLDMDSITYPKYNIRAFTRDDSDYLAGDFTPVVNGVVKSQANATQRYWFFGAREVGVLWYSRPETCSTARHWKNQRYCSLRGDR